MYTDCMADKVEAGIISLDKADSNRLEYPSCIVGHMDDGIIVTSYVIHITFEGDIRGCECSLFGSSSPRNILA